MAKKKKKDEKPIRLFTFDVETRGLWGEIFRAGLYDGETYYTSERAEDLLDIIKHSYSDQYECHLFVHNLDFDLSKVIHHLADGANVKESLFINKNVVTFISHSIIYHDSYRLLPAKLSKLCLDFGLEKDEGKMDLDWYMTEQGYEDEEDFFMNVGANDPILMEYLEKDCRSLYTLIQMLIEISGLTIHDFLRCPTVASLSMKVYKTRYPLDYKKACSSNYGGEFGQLVGEAMARSGYYGGRTEVFQPYMEFGYHYDVNSLYPYVMKVHDYPYGWYEIYQEEEAEVYWEDWLEDHRGGGFLWCKIHVPDMLIPPLPIRRKGKLMFCIGNLEGVWTFEEIEMAIKYGCTLTEIIQVMYFPKRDFLFRNFVTEMEVMKTTSKGAKRNFSKLMQNSLYGKFGMGRIREKLYFPEDKEKLEEEGRPYFECEHPQLGLRFLRSTYDVHADYIQPHIAAYVTSYARILLYESMMAAEEKGTVSYCDTDSMVLDFELPPELVDENEYGKWKLEYTVDEGIFIQPKLYYERTSKGKEVFKAKGVPGRIINGETKRKHGEKIKVGGFTRDTYVNILEAIKAGSSSYTLFEDLPARQKFGTSLMNGQDFDIKILLRKKLNLTGEQKRIMDYGNNISLPHKIDMEKEKEETNQEALDNHQRNWWKEQTDYFADLVKQYGYIQTVNKGERYYQEYKSLPQPIKRKYFRKDGVELDVWAYDHGFSAKELFDQLQGVS